MKILSILEGILYLCSPSYAVYAVDEVAIYYENPNYDDPYYYEDGYYGYFNDENSRYCYFEDESCSEEALEEDGIPNQHVDN